MGIADANCATIGRVPPVKRFNSDFKSECPSVRARKHRREYPYPYCIWDSIPTSALRHTLPRLLAQVAERLSRSADTVATTE